MNSYFRSFFFQVTYTLVEYEGATKSKREAIILPENGEENKSSTNDTFHEPEPLPYPSAQSNINLQEGTNIVSFTVLPSYAHMEKETKTSGPNITIVIYIVVASAVFLIILTILSLLTWKQYRRHRKTQSSMAGRVSVVERSDGRQMGDDWSEAHTPLTLSADSILNTVKVRTSPPVSNNQLLEDGTEV